MSLVIVVASVHHTGTKFVYRHLLERLEFVVPSTDTLVVDRNRKGYYGKVRIHIDEPLLPRLKVWMKEFPTIVPIRHPRAVALSWKAREKPLSWLEQQWEWLENEVIPRGARLLPLDTEDRDERLREISQDFGFPMKTDWPLICSAGLKAELTEEEERSVEHVMRRKLFSSLSYDKSQ